MRRLQRWVLLRISAAPHSNHSKDYLQKFILRNNRDMLPRLLSIVANSGPTPHIRRRMRAVCIPDRPAGRVPPAPALPGSEPHKDRVEGTLRGRQTEMCRFSDTPKVIGNKGLTTILTPLESTLTGCAHLFENTQVQPLQNQHLRIFSPQALWIQHLHKNMGGGGTPRFLSGRIPSASPHPPCRIKVRVPRHSGAHEIAL